MASSPDKIPPSEPPANPYARERIEKEIEHLRRRKSVRSGGAGERGSRLGWTSILVVAVLLGLFLLDPVLHSFRRNEAIRDYLYLLHYGSDAKAKQLAGTGIFTAPELELLNHREGVFQGYFAGPTQANEVADAIISYMQGVAYLHASDYDHLDWLGKVRYELFIRWGIHPPKKWHVLDPSIRD